jgi:hypothetical protein
MYVSYLRVMSSHDYDYNMKVTVLFHVTQCSLVAGTNVSEESTTSILKVSSSGTLVPFC